MLVTSSPVQSEPVPRLTGVMPLRLRRPLGFPCTAVVEVDNPDK
jgi:hypothetical protein